MEIAECSVFELEAQCLVCHRLFSVETAALKFERRDYGMVISSRAGCWSLNPFDIIYGICPGNSKKLTVPMEHCDHCAHRLAGEALSTTIDVAVPRCARCSAELLSGHSKWLCQKCQIESGMAPSVNFELDLQKGRDKSMAGLAGLKSRCPHCDLHPVDCTCQHMLYDPIADWF